MKTSVQLTPHSESLMKEHLGRGPYRSPEEVVERALEALAQKESNPLSAGPSPKSPAQAVARIRELRKGVRLNGLKIKDLINEGRKY